jgi:hypothetical protein
LPMLWLLSSKILVISFASLQTTQQDRRVS